MRFRLIIIMRIFAVIRWHCTNEKFSAQEYIDVNCNYPGDWDGAIERIEECEKGNLDIILTKSVSRFGRNTKEGLEAIRKLKACGTRIIFEADKIDTETVDDELLISVVQACCQAENDWRSENIRFGLKHRAEDGTSDLYSKACYGYKKINMECLLLMKSKRR